ncbi:hypothetical protein DRQ25_12155 [Candidatus Fermentibacteria bacterium]|nr:MAG: hypothetical protein DRQ25_12155 [Candidatus Fermentibacteria bacterium]
MGSKNKKIYTALKPLASWFQQAIYAGSLRGTDGTGIVAVDAGGLETYKKGVSGDSFMHEPYLYKVLRDIEKYDVLIGHNRAATRGGTNSNGAHPFAWETDGDTLAGVHNGTLRTWTNLKHYNSCSVDSDALFGEIASEGIPEALKVIQGAMALSWYDETTEKTYLFRNSERPLYIGWCKKVDAVLVASEPLMIEWLAERNNIELESVDEVEVNTLYTFDPYNNTLSLKDCLEKEVMEVYTAPKKYWDSTLDKTKAKIGTPVMFRNINWCLYAGNAKGVGSISGTTVNGIRYKAFGITQETFNTFKNKSVGGIINGYGTGYQNQYQEEFLRVDNVTIYKDVDRYNGPQGKQLTLKEFNDAGADGCCVCFKELKPEDHKEIVWYAGPQGSEGVCPDCTLELNLDGNGNYSYHGY